MSLKSVFLFNHLPKKENMAYLTIFKIMNKFVSVHPIRLIAINNLDKLEVIFV